MPVVLPRGVRANPDDRRDTPRSLDLQRPPPALLHGQPQVLARTSVRHDHHCHGADRRRPTDDSPFRLADLELGSRC